MLRRFGLIVLAFFPVVAAAFVSGKVADRIGRRLGAALDETLGAALRIPPPASAEAVALRAAEHPAPRSAEPHATQTEKAPATSRSSRPRAPSRGADRIPERGLRVSAQTVLRLAQSGARPSGTPVPVSQGCAAGLRLSGVSGLGVGLRDGDVLTHAAGRPASSRAEVVGAVIGARGARQREVSGRFCRDGEAWNLVVEQPYLDSAAEIDGPVASRADRHAELYAFVVARGKTASRSDSRATGAASTAVSTTTWSRLQLAQSPQATRGLNFRRRRPFDGNTPPGREP